MYQDLKILNTSTAQPTSIVLDHRGWGQKYCLCMRALCAFFPRAKVLLKIDLAEK